MSPDGDEAVIVTLAMDVTWRYASGAPMERFLVGLAAGRLEAVRCGACGRRYLPPRPFCGRCRVALAEWVPVADTGTLEARTLVHLPIRDGRTGEMRPSPYGMGLIRLDGADTSLNHHLDVGAGALPEIGSRVRAVWRPDRIGSMDDILTFEVVP
jgi:uncharacterized protein